MRILVYGAGAVGSVLGGFLAEAGHDVTLLGRAWHLDVVRREGLAITGLWGDHHVCNLLTATDVGTPSQPKAFDWIFVCVKAHQTAMVAATLPQFMGSNTRVCAFQNGLGNYEALIQHVESSRVAVGRVIFGAELEPGRVRVTVCADEVLIGAPDSRLPCEPLTALAAALKASGIPTRTTTSIMTALWVKVLYNCALNGLSTILEVPYGKLLDQPLIRRLMERIIEEAYSLAAAYQIPLEPPTAQAYCRLLFTRLIPDTAAHHPSMLQDLRRGKPTEIEAMNGAIVRMAQAKGLAVPINALVTRLVHAKEQFVGVPPASLTPFFFDRVNPIC